MLGLAALVAVATGPALGRATAVGIAPKSVRFTGIDDPAAAWDVGVARHPDQDTTLVQHFLAVLSRR